MAEKPVCGKCGLPHWRFVRCADAETRNQIEESNVTVREAAKVVPIWRHGSEREWRSQFRSVTQVAPNVFVRNTDGPDQAA